MDPKLAEKIRRSARKLHKTDECLRTDKETPVTELVENYEKARVSHQKNLAKLESA